MIERIIVGLLHTNAYIFSTGKKDCILIDAGSDPRKILRELEILNLIPRIMVFTHGHLDHVAAAGTMKTHYESQGLKLPIAIHAADAKYLGSASESVHRVSFQHLGTDDGFFETLYSPLPAAEIELQEGDTILDTDLTVIHTPGHTEGSICLYSESQEILFTGDTIFFKGIGRTDLPDGSGRTILESIKKKLFHLPPQTRIFPGHGPYSVLEREISHNPSMMV